MYFHTSLALFGQLALFTKTSMIWITLIRVAMVTVGPGIGSIAFPGYVES